MPNSRFVETSYAIISSLLLSFTFLSILPNPGVLILPERFTEPKSARRVDILPLAAQPPSSLKSLKRNSLTHISPDFGIPSSGLVLFCLLGLRIPIIIVTTLLKFGFPLTDILSLFSLYTEYIELYVITELAFCSSLFLDLLTSNKSSSFISILFAFGQTSSSTLLPGGLTIRGISYS